jgi:hypothetical protein
MNMRYHPSYGPLLKNPKILSNNKQAKEVVHTSHYWLLPSSTKSWCMHLEWISI